MGMAAINILPQNHVLSGNAAKLALLASLKPSASCKAAWETGVSPDEWPPRDGFPKRLLDITPAPSLSFIMDTMGSMGFGLIFPTSDPDSFWQQFNEIHALEGGDEPEMYLSALEEKGKGSHCCDARKVLLPLKPPVMVTGKPPVFIMDGLLQRVTIQIHREVSSFWIRNPEGVSQGQEEGQGPLETGTWDIQVTAKGNPQVRVQAQISFDFLFYFGGPMEDGPHPGLYPLTQPVTSPPPDLFINFICLQTQLLVEVTELGPEVTLEILCCISPNVVFGGFPEGAELDRVPLELKGPRE
uniref:von Willebrand factor A domain containing 7 n=1 Tax=Rousettus aegyptiacus TaxID=9407 RepID=A0A7J8KJI0_ROUAE|nr:von Willebrand factor A domain containing 7 [Rousettus aegyptiacus]